MNSIGWEGPPMSEQAVAYRKAFYGKTFANLNST